jgi:uncharacterized protein YdbL (DUF1318 family)
MVDVYSTEPERKAALAEVTALRRQFDTTTAKGAKAFAASKEAQDALKRLDAAKSAAGMRTSAEDLAALNRVATGSTGTTVKTADGRFTAKNQTKEEQAVTKQLNQPSRQYFKQVTQAQRESLTDESKVPFWKSNNQVTPEMIQEYAQSGADASKARFDWVWTKDPESGKGRWNVGLIGVVQQKPADLAKADQLDIFYSDSAPLAQARKGSSWNATFNNISLDELEEALPNITFSEFQELYYRLTLERNTDITIEDILDKYDEMFGEG